MDKVFTRFVRIDVPDFVTCEASGKNPSFEIAIVANGEIPFPQVILHAHGRQHLIKEPLIAVRAALDRVREDPLELGRRDLALDQELLGTVPERLPRKLLVQAPGQDDDWNLAGDVPQAIQALKALAVGKGEVE